MGGPVCHSLVTHSVDSRCRRVLGARLVSLSPSNPFVSVPTIPCLTLYGFCDSDSGPQNT